MPAAAAWPVPAPGAVGLTEAAAVLSAECLLQQAVWVVLCCWLQQLLLLLQACGVEGAAQ